MYMLINPFNIPYCCKVIGLEAGPWYNGNFYSLQIGVMASGWGNNLYACRVGLRIFNPFHNPLWRERRAVVCTAELLDYEIFVRKLINWSF